MKNIGEGERFKFCGKYYRMIIGSDDEPELIGDD